MKKVVFLNFPTHGCINGLLATAAELVERGHRLIYYCTDEFKPKIERTGAEFRSYQGLINDFKISNYDLFKALKRSVDMTVDKLDHNLAAIQKENPDYIIHDSLCTWGKHMAAILGLPAINLMHSYPVNRASMSLNMNTASMLIRVGLYKLISLLQKSSAKKVLRKKYNLHLSLSDAMINREDLNIVYTSQHMEPSIFKSETGYLFVGPSLFFKADQGDFDFQSLKGGKVLYISLGTLHNINPSFYKTCIEAFRGTAYKVVISVGTETDLNLFRDLPQNFIVRPSVPQQHLLEHVDLFITHAGMNSVNESICCGVPMLLLPHHFEQQLIANRVQELGMGEVMDIKKIKSSDLISTVHTLLSNSVYRNQALTYKSIFSQEEKSSHIKAVDAIIGYVESRQ